MKTQKTWGKWPDAYCPIFMEQKEVTSRDCYIILAGKEGVPTIVSNSEKEVSLLIKARAASLHSDISSDRKHEKSLLPECGDLGFPTAFEIGCQPGREGGREEGSCASFYDPTPPFCCGRTLSLCQRPKLTRPSLHTESGKTNMISCHF